MDALKVRAWKISPCCSDERTTHYREQTNKLTYGERAHSVIYTGASTILERSRAYAPTRQSAAPQDKLNLYRPAPHRKQDSGR